MLPRVLADYGAPKVDSGPLENPTSEFSSTEFNRMAEDNAQLTITSYKAIANFPTTAVAAPTTVAAGGVNVKSQWGSGPAQKPVVTKTAVGRYTLTYAATYTDALSVVETVNLFDAKVSVRSTDPVDNVTARVLTVANNVITIVTQSPHGTDADVGDNSAAVFTATVWAV